MRTFNPRTYSKFKIKTSKLKTFENFLKINLYISPN